MDEVVPVELEIVDPVSETARAAMGRYFAELDARFRTGFDVAFGGTSRDAIELTAPHGAFVVMRVGPEVIGCGGVQRLDDRTGEIKRMWIDPARRGRGLGRRLLEHLEQVAVELGRTRIVLDTNEVLLEAVRMYERAGYVAIERYNDNPYAHHWFEKQLAV